NHWLIDNGPTGSCALRALPGRQEPEVDRAGVPELLWVQVRFALCVYPGPSRSKRVRMAIAPRASRRMSPPYYRCPNAYLFLPREAVRATCTQWSPDENQTVSFRSPPSLPQLLQCRSP